MLEQVARRYPSVDRHQCDIRDLGLRDASLDVVFMNGMFGNIADKAGAMKNVVRMLQPRGRVVIGHPEGRAFVTRIAREEPLPITPLPSLEEARSLLYPRGLTLRRYVDEDKLLIAVAAKEGS